MADKNRIGKKGEAEKWDAGYSRSGMDVARENIKKLAQQLVGKQQQAPRQMRDEDPTQRSIDAAFGMRQGPSVSGMDQAPEQEQAIKFQRIKQALAPQGEQPASASLSDALAEMNARPQLSEEEQLRRTRALMDAQKR